MEHRIFLALAMAFLLFGCATQQIEEGMGENGRAYRGAKSPSLVIYEYSDFECPYCGKASRTMDDLLRAYPSVRLEFRHNPLKMHPNAFGAAVASVCAEEQGKFWKMHDLLFENQERLEEADLENYAKEVGLGLEDYRVCISSNASFEKVLLDQTDAVRAGADAAPYFIIGNTAIRGALPIEKFRLVIETELARGK